MKNPKMVIAGKKAAVSKKYNARIAKAPSTRVAAALKAAKTRALNKIR